MATLPHDTYANPTTPLWATSVGNSNISSAQITLTPPGLPTATGGTITYSGGHTIHTFTSSGTFRIISPSKVLVDILCVGGGGGAGGYIGGGGGGGVVATLSTSLDTGSYAISVGAGGTGQIGTATPVATAGSPSSMGSVLTAGGGGASASVGGVAGSSGAFTGGAWYNPNSNSGGGAGAGQNGADATASKGGNGGNGVSSSISGTATYYGGGGGGGFYTGSQGLGGLGGGANGSPTYNPSIHYDGTNGLGGGGGGASSGGVAIGGNGGSGIVIISYLTITPDVVLTNQGGLLAQNGFVDIATSLWSTTPATSNKIYMDATNILSNSGGNLYFNGNLLVNSGDLSNISDWALYPAVSNIECSNGGVKRSINNANAIGCVSLTATSNITGDKVIVNTISNATNLSVVSGATSVGLLSNSFPQITNSAFSSISNMVDRLVDTGGDANYTIVAKNGRSGIITLQANSGDNNEVSFGKITLTANGTQQTIGSVQYTYGGLIEMYANTPIPTGAGVVASSSVKINGAGVNIYAGSFNSFGSLAGQLYLWGQTGTSLTSSGSPPSPVVAGSVYIYGSNGTKMDGLVQMSNLSNISGSGFTINGGNNSGSHISNFNTIRCDTFYGVAGNYQTINVCNIQGYTAGSSITISTTPVATTYPSITLNSQSNINLITSNSGRVLYNGSEVLTSATYPNWSTIPATQSANLSNYDLSNVGNVRGGATLGLYATNINVNGGLNMLNNTISNVSNVTGSYININGTSSGINITTPGALSLTGTSGIIISNTTNVNADLYANGNFYRDIQGVDIAQPVIQSGEASGTGNSGSVAVTIPKSYVIIPKVFVTHQGSSPANTSVVVSTGGTFTIHWTNAGSGTQTFSWMSVGSYA